MKKLVACLVLLAGFAFAQGGTLIVLNKADNEAVFIDPATLKILGKTPTGNAPHEGIVSVDGKTLYVANYGDQRPGNSLSIIDVATRKVNKVLDLGPLVRPHGIIEVGGNIYFTAEASRAVARYNPAADKVDWIQGTGQAISHMVVAMPNGKKLFTPNMLSDTVTVIELPTTPGPNGVQHIKLGREPEGLDISPDGKELWVATRGDGNMAIIDTATNRVLETFAVGNFPIRVKFTPDGKRVLVSNAQGNEVVILEAATRKVIKRIETGETPIGILVQPDGKRAYIAASQHNKVLVIDLEKNEAAGSIETGRVPDGMAWAK